MGNKHAIPTQKFTGLPDYDDQGYDAYKGTKSDSNLKQLGGERVNGGLGKSSDSSLEQIGGEQC